MRGHHDGGSGLQRHAYGGHRRTHTRVFSDTAVLQRNVEIGRMNTRLPLSAPACASEESVWTVVMMHCTTSWSKKKRRAGDPALLRYGSADYLAFIKATVVSSMRLEKPHSLSYQDETLTRLPDTLVSNESTVLDAGLWLKSIETSGSFV